MAPEQDKGNLIQIEWAGAKLPSKIWTLLPMLQQCQIWHEQRHGLLNKRSSVYLDGIGLCLDGLGRHREAIRPRRQSLKISRRLNGAVHESTGAALSNLGLSLFAQGKHAEAAQYLQKSLKVLLECVGREHPATEAAMYNCYFCIDSQGLLTPTALPEDFSHMIPHLQDRATPALAEKVATLVLTALRDLADHAKLLVASRKRR